MRNTCMSTLPQNTKLVSQSISYFVFPFPPFPPEEAEAYMLPPRITIEDLPVPSMNPNKLVTTAFSKPKRFHKATMFGPVKAIQSPSKSQHSQSSNLLRFSMTKTHHLKMSVFLFWSSLVPLLLTKQKWRRTNTYFYASYLLPAGRTDTVWPC